MTIEQDQDFVKRMEQHFGLDQAVESDEDTIGEWVGLHYGVYYPDCTEAEKADWRKRYAEMNPD